MAVMSKTPLSKIIDLLIHIVLILLAVTCLLPFLNMVSISFSSSHATNANLVTFWPIGFNTEAYKMIMRNPAFITAFGISVVRTVIGPIVNMILIILTAYPLSKNEKEMKGRNILIWFFIFPMMFSGGLIPFFLQVSRLGLIDNFWVLIIPGAVPIFSVIMMMNFFRGLNKSFYEAAVMDGAGHSTVLFKIYIPLSLACIATLALFAMVGHWNDWFTGLIFLNKNTKWPLQTYLRQLLISIDFSRLTQNDIERLRTMSNRSFKSAQLFVATVPILCAYPFLQKYFVTGITMGSIKE